MAKLAYTIEEVAMTAAIGRTKIYEAIGVGVLRARKNGKRTVILAADLHQYLEGLPDFHDRFAK